MANVSGAAGTFKLEGAWTQRMRDDLNVISEEWRSWYYNTDIFETFSADSPEVGFVANGRWAYNLNLEELGEWTENSCQRDPALQEVYRRLCADMRDNDCRILVKYCDEEPGNGVLYTSEALIESDGTTLTHLEVDSVRYEYTRENLLELDVYDEEALDDIFAVDEEEDTTE
jgi:hypothetical protein